MRRMRSWPRFEGDGAAIKGPETKTDAILSCPCCFAIVCLDCQRHAKFLHQYRAVFVQNCQVLRTERLRAPGLALNPNRNLSGLDRPGGPRSRRWVTCCCVSCAGHVLASTCMPGEQTRRSAKRTRLRQANAASGLAGRRARCRRQRALPRTMQVLRGMAAWRTVCRALPGLGASEALPGLAASLDACSSCPHERALMPPCAESFPPTCNVYRQKWVCWMRTRSSTFMTSFLPTDSLSGRCVDSSPAA
jgi:hypothetical protein